MKTDMKTGLGYTIGSTMERDDLYAEITYYNPLEDSNYQWGEIIISDDKKALGLIIYPERKCSLSFF